MQADLGIVLDKKAGHHRDLPLSLCISSSYYYLQITATFQPLVGRFHALQSSVRRDW